MEQLEQIFDELKDKNELAILEKYSNIAKRFTLSIIGRTRRNFNNCKIDQIQ